MNAPKYINIQGWMLSLDLSLAETVIFAVIYGFSQDGESKFCAPMKYLQYAAKAKSLNTAKNAVKKLCDIGYVLKHTKTVNGVKVCDYSANLEIFHKQEYSVYADSTVGDGQNLTGVGKICPTQPKIALPCEAKFDGGRQNLPTLIKINNKYNKNKTTTHSLSPIIPFPSPSSQCHGVEEEDCEARDFSENDFEKESKDAIPATKPPKFGEEAENAGKISDSSENALCRANLSDSVKTENVRTLAKQSARRIAAKYPRRESGISLEVFALFAKDKLFEKENEILNAIEKWKQSPQWIKDGGKFIPSFQKFIAQEIWRFEPSDGASSGEAASSGTSEAFEKFWALFPENRRVAKNAAFELWRTKGCEAIAATICERLKAALRNPDLMRENYRYFPAPRRYIVEARWEDAEVNGKTSEESERESKERKRELQRQKDREFMKKIGVVGVE